MQAIKFMKIIILQCTKNSDCNESRVCHKNVCRTLKKPLIKTTGYTNESTEKFEESSLEMNLITTEENHS